MIVLVVIGVVVLIPVVFIIVRRKQGKTVIPSAIRPVLERISPCFAENKGGLLSILVVSLAWLGKL